MALSGSFNTTAYGNRYLTFSWTASQSIEDNTSTISWTLKGAGSAGGYYMAGPFYVAINGEMVLEQTTRIQLWNGTTVASGTKIVKHNNDGSLRLFGAVEAAIFSGSINVSGNSNWALDNIPRAATITSAPNFTDEDNPTITYSNLAGNAVSKIEACISFTGANADIPYREISTNDTSYTFNLTEAERQTLQNGVLNGSDSRTIVFYLCTTIGGEKYYTNVAKTLTIANSKPVLNPSAYDGGTISSQLTQNPSIIISGYNTMYVSTGAVAQKGASIVSQSITCGDNVINGASGTMGYVTSGKFTFTATDNRGQTTTKDIELTLIPYFKPTINFEAKAELADTNTTTINYKISGNWFNGDLGATKNGVKVRYRVAVKDEAYTDWVIVTPTVSGNTYNVEAVVAGLDYQKAYTIQARVEDAIYYGDNGFTSDEITCKTIPVFDWGENDFNFNVPIVSIQGNPIIDYPIEIGQEAMGTNGTWYWEKWASGKATCYGRRNYGNMAVSSEWGNIFSSASFNQDLPSGLFIDTPEYINIDIVNSSSSGAWVSQGYNGNATADNTGDFCVFAAISGNHSQVKLGFNIIGRWK